MGAVLSSFTMENVLTGATDLLSWVLGAMSAVLKFVTDNPIVLVLFFVSLISIAVGFVFRIWRSVG